MLAVIASMCRSSSSFPITGAKESSTLPFLPFTADSGSLPTAIIRPGSHDVVDRTQTLRIRSAGSSDGTEPITLALASNSPFPIEIPLYYFEVSFYDARDTREQTDVTPDAKDGYYSPEEVDFDSPEPMNGPEDTVEPLAISVGFGTDISSLPGETAHSFGFEGINCTLWRDGGSSPCRTGLHCGFGDRIGCGYIAPLQIIFFTLNGRFMVRLCQ